LVIKIGKHFKLIEQLPGVGNLFGKGGVEGDGVGNLVERFLNT
jgi:hypothetical protein